MQLISYVLKADSDR